MSELTLNVDTLVDQARQATGLQDFGADSWQEPLGRYVMALREEAALSQLGVQIAAGEILMYLVNRLSITDWHHRYPEMAQRDVTPPIVIVGMGRTGTTILHDLLAQDPAHRAPLTWEVDQPCPPPETATYETDPRIAQAQAQIDRNIQLVPALQATHPLGARLAQECVRMMGADFRSLAPGTQYRIPSYCRWLLYKADMAPAYRWHRRFLQLLQWRHPAERWVLKSPGHLWCLRALLAEYIVTQFEKVGVEEGQVIIGLHFSCHVAAGLTPHGQGIILVLRANSLSQGGVMEGCNIAGRKDVRMVRAKELVHQDPVAHLQPCHPGHLDVRLNSNPRRNAIQHDFPIEGVLCAPDPDGDLLTAGLQANGSRLCQHFDPLLTIEVVQKQSQVAGKDPASEGFLPERPSPLLSRSTQGLRRSPSQ